jgi:hypothetical protein
MDVSVKAPLDAPAVLKVDGRSVASAVLPLDARASRNIAVETGPASLTSVNAIVRSVRSPGDREIECELLSFSGHRTAAVFTSAARIERASLDGVRVSQISDTRQGNGPHRYELRFAGAGAPQHLRILFSKSQ